MLDPWLDLCVSVVIGADSVIGILKSNFLFVGTRESRDCMFLTYCLLVYICPIFIRIMCEMQ